MYSSVCFYLQCGSSGWWHTSIAPHWPVYCWTRTLYWARWIYKQTKQKHNPRQKVPSDKIRSTSLCYICCNLHLLVYRMSTKKKIYQHLCTVLFNWAYMLPVNIRTRLKTESKYILCTEYSVCVCVCVYIRSSLPNHDQLVISSWCQVQAIVGPAHTVDTSCRAQNKTPQTL